MHTTNIQAERLNSLLRGELAAVETYEQALAKEGGERGVSEIRLIHQDHTEAVQRLRQCVQQYGGVPDETSGAWGTWARVIEGAAKLFGHTAALRALKEGEKYGVKSYEAALTDECLPGDAAELFRTALLPRTRAHIRVLEQLIAAQ